VNVCVPHTAEEAEQLARPQLLAMVALRTGGELRPQLSVEAAAAVELPEGHQAVYDAMRARWGVGTPHEAFGRLSELAATYAVDEVMVHPVAGAVAGTAPDRSPAREDTLRLLANALGS